MANKKKKKITLLFYDNCRIFPNNNKHIKYNYCFKSIK